MVITNVNEILHVMLPVCGDRFEMWTRNVTTLRRLMVTTTARNWKKLKNGNRVKKVHIKIRRQVNIKLALA